MRAGHLDFTREGGVSHTHRYAIGPTRRKGFLRLKTLTGLRYLFKISSQSLPDSHFGRLGPWFLQAVATSCPNPRAAQALGACMLSTPNHLALYSRCYSVARSHLCKLGCFPSRRDPPGDADMEKLPNTEMLRLAGIMAQDVISEVSVADSAIDLLMHDETVPLDVRGKLSLLAEQVRAAAGPAKWLLFIAHTQSELRDTAAETVDPGEYLSDLSQLFRRLLPQNINFRMELNSRLWPVRFARTFDDALITLIVRARDAMPNGGDLLCRAANIDEATCQSMTVFSVRRSCLN